MALTFEANGLYLLLSDRGDNYTFHWGLYLAKSQPEGEVFHIVNAQNSTEWIYESQTSKTDRLSQIPLEDSTYFNEKITCRVWVKEALYALDDEGYIKLTTSIGEIEQEAKTQAMLNRNLGRKTTSKSRGSQA
ncbi:hypothetical protein BDV30DRAFT_233575 [Aspergillus minisclerotigenes]|uniref:Uncharacterized protein n=1 Tax=Aspergillus minisclerotigenes TaxID=656917 RepID=A0A5N6JIA4_9EURO|nr:hypothetical protein BDV30DRAFT_233575 [Aspergillus minisclerotigenes]